MRKLFYLSILSLSLFAQVQAIPPPEIILGIGQSLAQVIGITVATLIGGFFALHDFFRHQWEKIRTRFPARFGENTRPPHKPLVRSWSILIGCLFLVGVSSFFLFFGPNDRPVILPHTNQIISIEDVINQEPQKWYRDWKQDLLVEMKTNLDLYRASKGFTMGTYSDIVSFTPQQLYDLQGLGDQKILLLDVREENERQLFGIEGSMSHRYGDLVNNIFPDVEKTQKIIVLCYSGVRGYISASILAQHGFSDVGYIRGGLNRWEKDSFSIYGSKNFKFLSQKYEALTVAETEYFSGTRIDVSEPHEFNENRFTNVVHFSAEMMTTQDINERIKSIPQEPVMIICGSDSSCFDGVNLAYLLEKNGHMIIGYHKY